MDYQTTIKAKREAVQQSKTDQQQRDELAATVVKAVTDKGVKLYAQIDARTDAAELAALHAVEAAITKLQALEAASQASSDKLLASIAAALKTMDVKPVVHVPQQLPPRIDFGPLQRTIEQYFQPESETDSGIDLDCYKAQDMTESETVQYVGFLNPQGDWYIIENDIKANSMRYLFGSGNYAKAFARAASYKYKLLNEAIPHATA